MRHHLFASILFSAATALVGAATARAEDASIVVHGVVSDASTGKPVVGASVYREETDEVAITDDTGAFQFPPGPPGPRHLAVIDPSFQRAEASTDGATAVDIALAPLTAQSEVIVIEAERDHTAAGETQLRRDEITHVPGSKGDPLQAVKNLPGIANTAGFGPQQGLVIRGSSPASSRTFVDGFEIPLLYHLGGIQSVIPGEMIEDLVYAPGGFGVEWGKTSSGMVNVITRRGAPELSGFADVSFVTASGMLQGPIGKDGSFAVAVRRSYIDAVIPLVVHDSSSLSFTALPRYYDYQARADYRLTPHLSLGAFLIGSDDLFAVATDTTNPSDPVATGRFSTATSFQRAIVAATYDRPGLYSKLAVSGLNQRLGFEIGNDRFLHLHNQSLTARDDSRLAINDAISLTAGGQAELADYDIRLKLPRAPREGEPRQINFTYDPLIDTHKAATATNLAAWASAELAPAAWTRTMLGVRVDDVHTNHAVAVQPRLQQRIKLGDTTLLGAAGLYTRLPDYQDENLYTDLRPERVWQTSLGVETRLAQGVTLQTTAYYNAMSDLIVQRAADAMSRGGPSSYENAGVGRAYGAELLLQARFERLFGWASYTLAHSERRDHPMDAWRMFSTDQTHNLIVVGSVKLGAWQLGARFQYSTGTPFTPVTGAVFDSDRAAYMPEFGTVNSLREPAAHQLDLRADHTWAFHDWKLSGYLDISNVYMNAPIIAEQYNVNYTKRTEVTGMPLLPAIGIRGEF
jgi:outer membrane receptor protein involved in Fe transport